MTDTITTIAKLTNSPLGQSAAGGVLAGIVWKFFERVEAVLTDNTKLEIAAWLIGVKASHAVEHLPFVAANVQTVAEVLPWLQEAIAKHYPESKYHVERMGGTWVEKWVDLPED